jgi:hypothetical protein
MLRRAWFLAIWVAAGCGACTACKKDGTAETAEQAPPEKAPTKTIDPQATGSVSGAVLFKGTPPAPSMIRANADAACAKAHPGEYDAGDVLVHDGKVEAAFVWVKSGLEDYRFDALTEPVKVNQEGCMYHPRIFGARTNQMVEFTNSDQTLHNIDAKPLKSSGFNFVTPQGAKQARAIKRPEVMVKVGCDVHPWMHAFMGVLDHPFFRVTGADGAFELSGLPAGTFTIAAWHERLGEIEQSVTIAAGDKKTIELAVPGPGAAAH